MRSQNEKDILSQLRSNENQVLGWILLKIVDLFESVDVYKKLIVKHIVLFDFETLALP